MTFTLKPLFRRKLVGGDIPVIDKIYQDDGLRQCPKPYVNALLAAFFVFSLMGFIKPLASTFSCSGFGRVERFIPA
jgi:hypothetical protein